jgi:hypothetical protein
MKILKIFYRDDEPLNFKIMIIVFNNFIMEFILRNLEDFFYTNLGASIVG